jgi:hypothetical protein
MAATIEICETNEAGVVVTHDIDNSNMGSIDAPDLDPVSYKIDAGDRSYIKYQRIHVTNMGGSSAIDDLRIWRTGALAGSTTHVTNARTSSYGGALTYATPVQSAVSGVNQAMPTTTPASANLGIGGSLAGSITSAGYSDYLGHQIVTNANDTEGADCTLSFQYRETA